MMTREEFLLVVTNQFHENLERQAKRIGELEAENKTLREALQAKNDDVRHLTASVSQLLIICRHTYGLSADGYVKASIERASHLLKVIGEKQAQHTLKEVEAPAELGKETKVLREALQLLYDTQNGCPLPKYEADWNRAMELAGQALKEV